MISCVALFRGINVGTAKRVAMADLKALFESQGFSRVRTLLNSGNVLFEAQRADPKRLAQAIEASFEARFGFTSNVTVITAAALEAIVAANPLLKSVRDPARHLVAFARDAAVLEKLKPLAKQPWSPDALAITKSAAYLWCAKGVLESPLNQVFSKAAKDAVTARNWATVLKIQAAAARPPAAPES